MILVTEATSAILSKFTLLWDIFAPWLKYLLILISSAFIGLEPIWANDDSCLLKKLDSLALALKVDALVP